jgi:hypothetical protein
MKMGLHELILFIMLLADDTDPAKHSAAPKPADRPNRPTPPRPIRRGGYLRQRTT